MRKCLKKYFKSFLVGVGCMSSVSALAETLSITEPCGSRELKVEITRARVPREVVYTLSYSGDGEKGHFVYKATGVDVFRAACMFDASKENAYILISESMIQENKEIVNDYHLYDLGAQKMIPEPSSTPKRKVYAGFEKILGVNVKLVEPVGYFCCFDDFLVRDPR